MKLASNADEFAEICNAPEAPFIRSMDDWKEAVDAVKNNRSWRFVESSPEAVISKLSDEAIKQWEESVEFKNGGLAHGNYELIDHDLGRDGVVSFFRAFGMQEELFKDYENMRCVAHGDCGPQVLHICTGNC